MLLVILFMFLPCADSQDSGDAKHTATVQACFGVSKFQHSLELLSISLNLRLARIRQAE